MAGTCTLTNRTPWRLVPTTMYFDSGRFAVKPPSIIEPGTMSEFRIASNDWELTGASGGMAMQLMMEEGPKIPFAIVRGASLRPLGAFYLHDSSGLHHATLGLTKIQHRAGALAVQSLRARLANSNVEGPPARAVDGDRCLAGSDAGLRVWRR